MERNESINNQRSTSVNEKNNLSFENVQQHEDCRDRLQLNRDTTNLESHQLIWFSPKDEFPSLGVLRNIVDYVHLFDNIKPCRIYIEKTNDTLIFLICSQKLAHTLIPRIHSAKHIHRIYVYENQNNPAETFSSNQYDWFSTYKKVKPIYANIEHLLTDLSTDVQLYLERERKGSDIFWSKYPLEDNSMDSPKSSWDSLVDFWLYLPYPTDCRQRFVHTLKKYYDEDRAKMKFLEDFEHGYNGENAIQYYTGESFLYAVLNRALRQQNLSLMFLFGFFLQDMHRQLQREYKQMKSNSINSKVTLYRGQYISSSEIRHQKSPLAPPLFFFNGPKVITNSFFSTTSDRARAVIQTNPALDPNDTSSIQSVLFEIEANISTEDDDDDPYYRRPFASIANISGFESEEETLFMFGTSFRYNQETIKYNEEEHLWIIKLELDNHHCGIYEKEFDCLCRRTTLKRCMTILKNNNRKRLTSIPPSRLKLLFREVYQMYPTEKRWLSAIESHCLAVYHQFQSEKYGKALSHYYRALKRWSYFHSDHELNCFLELGEIHYEIACCFNFELNDVNQASSHYDQSIQFYELAISEQFSLSNYERIQVYKDLALVFERRNRLTHDKKEYHLNKIKYHQLYFEDILKYYPLKDTIDVWPVLDIIADNYEYVGNIDLAISYYETALVLREGLITLEDYSKITDPQENIALLIGIYRKLIQLYLNSKQNYQLALTYRLIIHEYELQKEANNNVEQKTKLLAYYHSDLADIYRGLNQYQLTYEHLQKALNQFEELEPSNSIYLNINSVKEKINSLTSFFSSSQMS